MTATLAKEINQIIRELKYPCTVETFREYCWNEDNFWGVSKVVNLSEEFILEFREELNWAFVIQNSQLSANVIRKCEEFIHWDLLSKYQILSLDIIETYAGRVNWASIFVYQDLPQEFRKKYQHKIKNVYG